MKAETGLFGINESLEWELSIDLQTIKKKKEYEENNVISIND